MRKGSQLVSFDTVNRILMNSLAGQYNSYVRLDFERISCNNDTALSQRCLRETIISCYCADIREYLKDDLSDYGASNINTHNSKANCSKVINNILILMNDRKKTNDIFMSQFEHIRFMVTLAKKFNNYAKLKSKNGNRQYYPFDEMKLVPYQDIENITDEDTSGFIDKLSNYIKTEFVEPLESEIKDSETLHQYYWLYTLLNSCDFLSQLNKEEIIFKILAIVMLLALDMKDLTCTSEPFMRAVYKYLKNAPDDFDAAYQQFKHSIKLPNDEKTPIMHPRAAVQPKHANNLIAEKIEKNQELEELAKEFETLIAKIGDMLAEYDQFSSESTEIEAEIKKTLNSVERKRQIFNMATVQGKTKELAQLRNLYDQQSSYLQLLSTQFTQSRSK